MINLRRHKVDILIRSSGQDNYGDSIDSWKVFKGGIWASKEPIIGKEFYTALTTDVQVDAKFLTGYFPGTNSAMRLKNGENIYEIIGEPININDRNIELLFYCRLVK
ncbi:phage head closure protein [Lachnoclostridium sp.]|uniref:phage head closure protein n=1 Tax=Lachnoclostridium sp. TaxID=2028282 RepID=UPI00289B2A89|nr:phage head closure protein [Lachnoclostridium sp.]